MYMVSDKGLVIFLYISGKMVAIPLRREALLKTTRKIANLGNKNFNVLCPHCGKMENLLSPKFFPSNQL